MSEKTITNESTVWLRGEDIMAIINIANDIPTKFGKLILDRVKIIEVVDPVPEESQVVEEVKE
jgi:hypothetical protein